MTREDHIEEIAFDIECYNFFKQLSHKYKDTNIGVSSAMSMQLLKEKIRRQTKEYKIKFRESVNVHFIESIA